MVFLFMRRYIASSGVVGKAGRENKQDLPNLRIKVRYQSISVLPMEHYQGLLEVSRIRDGDFARS